jgi:hypothetical protein
MPPPFGGRVDAPLRAPPYRINGPELKALVDLFETYNLVRPSEAALPFSQPCAPVPGLKC